MLVSFIALLLMTVGSLALTYLYKREHLSFLFRLAMAHVIGEVVFSLIVFLLACAFGFSLTTISVALFFTLLPAVLFLRDEINLALREDISRVRRTLKNLNPSILAEIGYYSLLIIAMYFFFCRAMIQTEEGIFTGSSHNLGDLPLHLGIIFSFTEANNFPPMNPSFTYTKLTYPFMSDLVAASLVKLGCATSDALLIQNLWLIFSVILLMEYFVFSQLQNRFFGKLSTVILLLCGGLGFVDFLRDYWNDGRSISEFLWNINKDYTIRAEVLRWGNSLTTIFITQRSFILGFPLALIILSHLWKLFSAEKLERFSTKTAWQHVFIGLLAGCLPLVHVHTLLVLFVVCAVLFFLSLEKWREWTAFGFAVSIIAVPELVWSTTGSATSIAKFIEPHFGWDKGETNFFVFWFVNLGLFIPFLLLGLFSLRKNRQMMIFYLPFALLFLIGNTMKLAPWEWDNIKVLIYWFTASVPFVVVALAKLWRGWMKILVAFCFFSFVFAGTIDVWRVMSEQIKYDIFRADAVRVAEMIKTVTPQNAIFLNAPTYNSAVVLSGRQSIIRYTGHLESYGIDYSQRESDVKKIYKGGPEASILIAKYGINYLIISPEEWGNLDLVNEDYFKKFPIVAQSGAYKVYEVRKP